MIEYEIPFVCLIFTALLNVVFFAKKKVKLEENFYFKNVLIFTLLVNITNFISHYGASIYLVDTVDNWFTNVFANINKLGSLFIIIITFNVMSYIFYISFEKYRKNIKLSKSIKFILYFIFGILLFLLEFNVIKNGNVTSGEGSAVTLTFVIVFINLFIAFMVALFNLKKFDKRYYSIYIIIPFLLALGIFVMYHPEFNIYDLILALLCYLMYFTIENPDLNMLRSMELAKTQAEKANAAKSDFLSSMSHEIRTPLNAIKGFSELTAETSNINEANKNAREVIKATDILLEIINGVLDISKVESGSMEIIKTEYNPIELFNDSCKMINVKMKEKGLKLNINIAKDIPTTLYGDKANIQKCIMNLLSNATKYTDEGQVDFIVQCINKNNYCTLYIFVKDTGRGIRPEKINSLFNKFERANEDRNTTTEGTGLGLAITKQLLELMGGKVAVESIYGSGSKFTIGINQEVKNFTPNNTPIFIPDEKEQLEKNEQQVVKTSPLIKTREFKESKVLMVDDNNLNLKVSEKILDAYKFELVSCNSAKEVIDKINAGENFDLLLIDDMMPKMSGTELMQILKTHGYKVPMVVLTANVMRGEKEKYLKAGFDDYLGKPMDRKEIDRVINKYLIPTDVPLFK